MESTSVAGRIQVSEARPQYPSLFSIQTLYKVGNQQWCENLQRTATILLEQGQFELEERGVFEVKFHCEILCVSHYGK
jgi:hypothetical protein